jgi:hypothetical protein
LARVVALSNHALSPGINWTTLGPPVMRGLAARGARVIEIPPLRRSESVNWRRTLPAVRRCDALFWMQGASRPEWPVLAAAAAGGIKRRSAYVIDAWPYVLDKITYATRLERLNPCFVAFREGYDELMRRHPAGRYEWLPFGADTEAFSPLPHGQEKDIFAFWMGRRHEPLHEAMERYCKERGLTYFHAPGGAIPEPGELGRTVARARYFVVTPPDLDHPDRAAGFSPLVMRYIEGLAAGTRLVGVLPRSGEYEQLLPLDAILQVAPDGSDLAARFEEDRENWTARSAAVAEACEQVRREHSWRARANRVMDVLS